MLESGCSDPADLRRSEQQRMGAGGQYGSIAVVERFMRTLKSECTRQILVPRQRQSMCRAVDLFAIWYNTYRPHQGLAGQTPHEVRCDAAEKLSLTPNSVHQRRILRVSYLEGQRHLPIIELRPAA